MNTDHVLWAFTVGLAAGFIFMSLSVKSYRKTLLLKSTKSGYPTPERLPDGQFYYIVHESEYNKLNQLRLQQLQEPFGIRVR